MKIIFGTIAGLMTGVAITTEMYGLLGGTLIATLASIDCIINDEEV